MTPRTRLAVAIAVVGCVALVAAVVGFTPGLLHRLIHNHPGSETTRDLRRMFDGAVHHYETSGRFPASAPLTPAVSACQAGESVEHAYRAEEWLHPTWQALEFRPKEPFRMQYTFVSDGTQFTARAHGDLNCDGVLSTFERFGYIGPDGAVNGGAGLFKKAPLE